MIIDKNGNRHINFNSWYNNMFWQFFAIFDIDIWKVHELIFIIGASITFIDCIILFTALLI